MKTPVFLAPVLMLELGGNQRENNLTGVRKKSMVFLSLLGKDSWFYMQLILWLSLCLSHYLRFWGTSLVVQWLRLCVCNAEGPGSIPGQGTRSHRLQLRVQMPQLKIPYVIIKIRNPVHHNEDPVLLNITKTKMLRREKLVLNHCIISRCWYKCNRREKRECKE